MQQIISEADYLALINKAEHLQAENESLKQLLQEYQQIAMQKQKEWQQQETSSTEIASNLENQFIELESKKNYILDLLQQAEAAFLINHLTVPVNDRIVFLYLPAGGQR